MSCPICEWRKPKRFCPAKGERICAVCCGIGREATIDCPSDCLYLQASRRYEIEHRKPVPFDELSYPKAEFSADLLEDRQAALSGIAYTILKFGAGNPSLHDADVLAALGALAEAFRTLGTGIFYEKPPDAPLPRALYGELAKFLAGFKKEESQRASFIRLKDSEIFYLLVFLLRVGKQESNGRPLSRAFVDFLRAQFSPASATQKEVSRIILP